AERPRTGNRHPFPRTPRRSPAPQKTARSVSAWLFPSVHIVAASGTRVNRPWARVLLCFWHQCTSHVPDNSSGRGENLFHHIAEVCASKQWLFARFLTLDGSPLRRMKVMPHWPETRVTLLQRIGDSRDHEAWEEFVALYGPMIFTFARHRLPQDEDAA